MTSKSPIPRHCLSWKLACGIVLAFLTGAAGCGGIARKARVNSSPQIVARVAGQPITTATLAHWMYVLAPQHVVPRGPQRLARTQQALALLISADWLTGEAAASGLGVSKLEIVQRLERRKRSFPNGEAEFRESLAAVAHTQADLELELAAELAAEKIRQSIQRAEPPISEARIAGYYAQNIHTYEISERRYIYLVENLKTRGAATQLIREVGHGRNLAEGSFHESFLRSQIAGYTGEKRTILEAIFAARPHVVAKPVELNRLYFVFK